MSEILLSPRSKLISHGNSWQVITNSAFAPVTAIPTTTAAMVLYNGESRTSGTGLSYVIDSIASVRIVVDATQANNHSVWAMLNQGSVTAPTDDTNLTIRSLIGRQNAYVGKALKAVAQSVTNHTWFPIGNSPTVASTVTGAFWNSQDTLLDGGLIIPPGGQLNLSVIQLATPAGQMHLVVRWHEVFLPIPLL